MQFRLRTLVIATAVGPPLLAGLWLFADTAAELIGCSAIMGLFVIWYLMLLRSQANPKMRGEANYDPPIPYSG